MDTYSYIHDLLRYKKYDKALSVLLNPSSGRILKPYNSDLNHGWYIVGDIYSKKQNFLEAIKAFRKSLNARMSDSQSLWAIADAYSELKKPKLAERYYRKALMNTQTHIEFMTVNYNLGNAMFDQKRYDEAMAYYKCVDKASFELYELAQSNIKLCLLHKSKLRTD